MSAQHSGEKKHLPDECPGAVDYGHHGRERCVWCGLERDQSGSQGSSDV